MYHIEVKVPSPKDLIESALKAPQTPNRPLFVQRDIPLTISQLRRLYVLERFNLDEVAGRVQRERQAVPEQVDEWVYEFRRYMGLFVIEPRFRIDMFSYDIDQIWHGLILDTTRYQGFCEAVHQKFFDHIPYYQPSGEDPTPAWNYFHRRYLYTYGEFPEVWAKENPTLKRQALMHETQ